MASFTGYGMPSLPMSASGEFYLPFLGLAGFGAGAALPVAFGSGADDGQHEL